jgi:hypothetical protein
MWITRTATGITRALVTYGHNKYDLDRDVLGAKLNSDYKAKVWDVEAKAKYLNSFHRPLRPGSSPLTAK